MFKKLVLILIFLCLFLIGCKSQPKKEVQTTTEEEKTVVEDVKLDVDKVNSLLSRLTADYFVKNKDKYSKSQYKKWESRLKSANVLEYLKKNIPNGYYLQVTGHADVTGTELINTNLSKRRAQYIKRKLTSFNIPEEKIAIFWKGSKALIVPSYPESAANRRVELQLVKN